MNSASFSHGSIETTMFVHQHRTVAQGVRMRSKPVLTLLTDTTFASSVETGHLGDAQPDHRQHQQEGDGEAEPYIEEQAAQRGVHIIRAGTPRRDRPRS
jgi:hypothetical protein